MRKIILIMSALLTCFSITGCNYQKINSDKIKIICSTYAPYNWLEEIIKGKEDLYELSLLLKNGEDLHNYQPTVEDIVQISSADMFICVGGESENWVKDALVEAKNKDLEVIYMKDYLDDCLYEEKHDHVHHNHHEHDEQFDEHIWLSLKNACKIVEELSFKINELDSDNCKLYQKNTNEYLVKLNQLDKDYENNLSKLTNHTLIFADRFPFRYLLEDYHLDYYAAFPGCEAESEASFETITSLINKVDDLKLSAVLIIDDNSYKLANTIVDNTLMKNQKILMLDSLQSVSFDKIDEYNYLNVMKDNLKVLIEALK